MDNQKVPLILVRFTRIHIEEFCAKHKKKRLSFTFRWLQPRTPLFNNKPTYLSPSQLKTSMGTVGSHGNQQRQQR
uniref:Uncharacterized protein n=1 Tax=Octopus bimaculoides TaxID=37653 RepID=A0A0L8H682_OCTBM